MDVRSAQAALLAVSQYLAAATAGEPDPVPTGVGGPPFLSADGVAFEVEAPDAEAANTVHREAHGLVADEVHEVKEGS